MHSDSPCSGTGADSRVHPALASMTWRDFERLIGEEFRRRGFIVTGFGGGSPGGSGGSVDLALMRRGERFLVECKQWRKQQVDVTVVRDLCRIIRSVGACGGYLFTGGEFTCESRELARSSRIELIDGALLAVDWLRSARSPEAAPAPLALV